jgi:hypothetical protein
MASPERRSQRLTDKGVKSAGIGRHGDGGGLYLEVKPASRGGARKAWLLRFQVNKQRRRPAIGKSARRRWYRLWTRPEATPQDGHGLFALVACIVITAPSPSLNASSAEIQVGPILKRGDGADSLAKPGQTAPRLHQK